MEKQQFNGNVIRRFLTGRAYEEFLSNYNSNVRSQGRGISIPTEEDFAILDSYKRGNTSIAKLSKEFNKPISSIRTSLTRAALARI